MKRRATFVWLILLIVAIGILMVVPKWFERFTAKEEDEQNERQLAEFKPKHAKIRLIEEPSAPSFIGTSNQLKQTVIVPTLETPIPANKSAIWCATTNLAWKELCALAGSDVTIGGQTALSKQLNESTKLDPALEEKDYYAKAGLIFEGIYPRIRSDLVAKGFTKIKPPVPDGSGENGVVTFACLQVAMKYAQAFLNDDEPLKFRNSQGNRTSVKSFGIRTKDNEDAYLIRGQVDPFFHDAQGHYAVDVSSQMRPYQVIVACVERGSNLRECIEDFHRRKKQQMESPKNPLYLAPDSILSIPNMEWEIDHTYAEMLGQSLSGKKLPNNLTIVRARQWMRVKMDRTGLVIVVQNETSSITDGDEIHPHPAGHFIFDHPYLLMILRRGESSPFFAMWVDNVELLQKR